MLKAFLLMGSLCISLIALINILVGLRHSWDIPTFSKNIALQTYNQISSEFSQQLNESTLKSMELKSWGAKYSPNRILCAVPTIYPEHKYRLDRIARTWGPMCDVLVWVVDNSSIQLPDTKVLGGENLILELQHKQSDDVKNTWEKTHRMLSELAGKYSDRAEWFAKIDDDTFAMVENLRNFVQFYNPYIARYFGHTLLHLWKSRDVVYNGGAMYVLSKESLLRVAPILREMQPNLQRKPANLCTDRPGQNEDVALAVCLKHVEVHPDNTLDAEGKQRFLVWRLKDHIAFKRPAKSSYWFWKGKPSFLKGGVNCCTRDLISMHGFKGNTEEDEVAFTNLQDEYNSETAVNQARSRVEVPPLPQRFQYDEELVVEDFVNMTLKGHEAMAQLQSILELIRQ